MTYDIFIFPRHLPAACSFADRNPDLPLARTWPGAPAFATLAEATSWPEAVFDVAVPRSADAGVLAALPELSFAGPEAAR